MNPIHRVKTPVILQMEAVECGAAALAIILAYYHRYVSLEELRYVCGVSRDGSKALNILRAARSYGLKAQGAEADLADLSKLSYPCIAFWEFNHFVVIEGFDNNKVYINDPAVGLRSLTYKEFSLGFTGVVLLFELTSEFVPGGVKDTLWHNLKSRFSGTQNAVLFIILASLFLTIPNILMAAFAKIFIDEVLIRNLSGWLLPLLWGMLLTGLMAAVLTWIEHIHIIKLQLKLVMTTSAQFLWHTLRLPMSFFSQRFSGDISSRIASNDHIAELLSADLSSNVVGLINMVIYALIMMLFDWMLAGIGICIALINALVFFLFAKKIANRSMRLYQEEGKLTGMEMAGLQGIETLKASGVEDDYFQRWAGYHAKTINSQQSIELYSTFMSLLSPILLGVSTALILGIGSLRIMDGYLTVGGLIAFQYVLLSFNEPLNELIGLGTKLQEIRADLSRLNDILNNPEDTELMSKKLNKANTLNAVNQLDGTLTMKNISYGYSPLDEPIVKEINLSLVPGKSLAIVGSTGSGKSTIAKLACGLYKPWCGDIALDNHRYSELSRELISSTLAFVDQDIFLFEGSILDNLTLWDSTVSTTAVEQAIEDAELISLLEQRGLGLTSPVHTQGANFSGGERQQLEIARALVTKPKLLVLDEATSSLDAITEAKIFANLKKRGCSLLVVAHRLSTIRSCDEILVIEQGMIVERGTHESLIQLGGVYKRLLFEVNDG
ncbi:NHLP family bacteriocin export ABC transporter peptidase/permease/ATPase subunit [Legionella bononiensis]|uniref:NHLP family bacteriocin export ABC transporter peptidase/permease/ATPase subunit n=1 Tax=Legionella bononiensis TaxID=2793102 RepID=A0ABS1WCH3_9GAMM|nr:NHLP family bacteriocin export ABC transporter peptidase/permease/ATPase subunit [Legionella bononiensis]MBL7478924.1 NHLP family bacteriocin export ABC transporter peptidase/permease/ATPase subunit [Legionella bononiensis]MBL7527056.1 NHLP family bacteriocin export ABC transporter peptidase/permease/ATPase subunit [Legionella bononiensis]MBL7562025.1 NHLP family bacteriocin export ABC transporter peptidase/permease/ATPase subunit [Legionella bononiensis]